MAGSGGGGAHASSRGFSVQDVGECSIMGKGEGGRGVKGGKGGAGREPKPGLELKHILLSSNI